MLCFYWTCSCLLSLTHCLFCHCSWRVPRIPNPHLQDIHQIWHLPPDQCQKNPHFGMTRIRKCVEDNIKFKWVKKKFLRFFFSWNYFFFHFWRKIICLRKEWEKYISYFNFQFHDDILTYRISSSKKKKKMNFCVFYAFNSFEFSRQIRKHLFMLVKI